MSVYDQIVEAINDLNDEPLEIKAYLQSLKTDVKQLRASYRKPPPVYVNYALQNIQSAYLITYLPHYYQLIFKILLEQELQIMKSKTDFTALFIGGGPGSEAYGTIKYILEYCPNIKNISIEILDLNSRTWDYSHSALIGFLLPELNRYKDISVKWNSHQFDLVDRNSIHSNAYLFKKSDIVVIQNCINEIARTDYAVLEENVLDIFRMLPDFSSLLMVDLTTSVRSKIAHLEQLLESHFRNLKKATTSENRSPSAMTSINHRPSQIVRDNLLNYTDGLIPRKNLKYDFSLLSKNCLQKEEEKIERIGINAIYHPLRKINGIAQNLTDRSFIGVDFGTSSSVCSIAFVQDGSLKVELLEIDQKDHLGSKSSSTIVPSIMGIVGKQFLLGKYAQERRHQFTFGQDGWYGFKENILNLNDQIFPESRLFNHPSLQINNGADALIVFFKRLKSEIDRLVIKKGLPLEKRFSFSTPGNYGLKEKELLESYIINAGFEQGTFSFVEEPVSSLLGTIYQENLALDLEKDLNILVIDVGAGTVDCCAIRLTKDSDNVLAETLSIYRNKNIGGNLINKLIANRLYEKDNQITINDDFVLKDCEEIKLQFCRSFLADAKVDYTLPKLAYSEQYKNCQISAYENGGYLQLAYSEFNEIMEDYFNGSEKFKGFRDNIEKTLLSAELKNSDLDYIIISGGGAKNPYLRSLCATYFDVSKIIMPNNSQEQVGVGNAIQSFVSNAFGKQIIESVLNGNIHIVEDGKQKPVFRKGEVLPSLEYELNVDDDLNSTELYSEITNESIYFNWKEYYNAIKIILKINQESRVVCDLVTDSSIIRLKPLIKKKKQYEVDDRRSQAWS
ncbi:Hsp70 protein [Salegentibacter sp. 24]|uniref:Hsp70 family protein n=1 Tax=Salegentibacter sp. 24 TaxID=2183986 RepID=UPI00105B2F26|nr:Hsp70 family protein [Salegentibacter sp. 24]TDN87318.1 Hsp70 protein [Salegentibacter sp. 24]